MHFADYFDAARIQVDVSIQSKKRLLEFASELIGKDSSELTPRMVYSQMCARESIGSTGLGYGIALPHGRVPESDVTLGAIIRLKDPVDFNAPDKVPVDVAICLALPEHHGQRHQNLLGLIAEFLHSEDNRRLLRESDSATTIMETLRLWQSAV